MQIKKLIFPSPKFVIPYYKTIYNYVFCYTQRRLLMRQQVVSLLHNEHESNLRSRPLWMKKAARNSRLYVWENKTFSPKTGSLLSQFQGCLIKISTSKSYQDHG